MGGMLDFISGAANAGAEIVGNRIAQAQKVDSEIDLQSRLTPIMAEREKAVGEERNRLALALNQGKIDQESGQRRKDANELNAELSAQDGQRRLAAFKKDTGVSDADIEAAGGADAVMKSLQGGTNYDPTNAESQAGMIKAGLKTGQLSAKDAVTASGREASLDTREKYLAARLDLDRDKLSQQGQIAMAKLAQSVAGISSGNKSRIDQAKEYWSIINQELKEQGKPQIPFQQAYADYFKPVQESYSQNESVNPITGDKEVSTTTKGKGKPPPAGDAVEIRYDANGNGYRRGADGRPVLVKPASK